MNTSLFAVFALLLLAGCDLPDSSVRAASKDEETRTTNASPSRSNAVVALTLTDGALASQANATLPPPAPTELSLPGSALEVIRLAHQQLGDGVLTNFVATIKEPFHLDSDQIVYLRDVGVSPTVIEALLVKQSQLDVDEALRESKAEEKPAPLPVAQVAYASPIPPTPTQYPGDRTEATQPEVGPAVSVPQPAPEEPQPVVNNFNFFYDSLAPYGNWVTVPSYGYVWQPSCAVVTPGWRPYWNNGGWVWSDCGWYWNSSYSWGWAPFHYGNWFNSPGFGWCWAPGNVWGPSWVTFRYSAGYCGWAPLPPGCGWQSGVGLTWAGSGIGVSFGFGYSAANYCWTPTGYFAAQNCSNFGMVGNRASHVYNNSQVINNYVVGNNNTIINGGIDPSQIQKQSRSEIRKVQLADANSPAGSSSRMLSRPGAQPSQLAVYRPAVSQSTSAPRSVTARSEVRPVSASPISRSGGLDRSPMPPRNSTYRTEPSPATRVDIAAGAGSPLGSPVKLLGRPGGQSPPPTTNPRSSFSGSTSPTVNPSPVSRNQLQDRSTRYTGQSALGGNSRLEPRKPQPSPTSNASETSGPARVPVGINGNANRPSPTVQAPARSPMAARTPPVVTRGQPSGTRDASIRQPMTSTRSFNSAPQTPRPVYSAPTMSSGSRPQFSAGGGLPAGSGGSMSRPSARP